MRMIKKITATDLKEKITVLWVLITMSVFGIVVRFNVIPFSSPWFLVGITYLILSL